jgi:L-ascorbate metabolism protein UlaG (beta-lactamase superfamily)
VAVQRDAPGPDGSGHTLTFIGTATTLLRLGAFTVLTDPNFLHRGQRAYLGKGLWSRRLTEPAMQPAELPALDAVVPEIAQRHPDIDVAVVHLGGTRVLLHTVTMDAQQGVDFLRRAHPRKAVPVHYDDYQIFRSPLSAFVAAAGDSGLATTIARVERGQAVSLVPTA